MTQLGGDESVDEAVRAAVSGALAALDQRSVAAEMTARIEAGIPELRGDRAITDSLAASVVSNVETVMAAMLLGVSPAEVQPPLAAIEYPRRLAQRGLPVTALVRAYRLGQASMMEQMLVAVRGSDLPDEVRELAPEWLTRWSFEYSDTVIEQVIEAYDAERDRWSQGRFSAQVIRVRELLADDAAVDVDAASRTVGYPLHRQHVAVVAWSPEGAPSDEQVDLLAVLGRELAATGNAPLCVAADQSSAWGWVPISGTATQWVRDAAQRVVDRTDGARLALGTVGTGIDGFRRSHREAMAARSVVGGDAVIDAAAPAILLTAMVGADPTTAIAWARAVLGPLADDSESDLRLRETLAAHLGTGGSYKATAALLSMHPNSVKYRVQRAVARRGREIGDDRLDVEVALRVLSRVRAD